ncbi:MAG: sugar ABC transporter substrate-binding protein [Acidobacteria bacterium]|nr:sugar ABC transporter substrate-binding protein [Acidobacteriota bacterium]MBI3263608.1 sugar ABC transporter substrate-binding protein [Acidobacteriota bacterium]
MRPRRRQLVRWVIALVMCTALVACNRGGAGGSAPRIALVLKTLNSPFFNDMQRGAQAAATRLGVELVVQAAEREIDVERQMQIVENLIQSGVNAICLTPSGSKEVVPAVVKANRANIPVIIVDTRLDRAAADEAGAKIGSFTGSDNYEGGRLAAQFVVNQSKGQANVGVLEGIPGHETGDSRLRGFREGIAATPGVRVVASQPGNWERDQGFNVFQNMLQAHPEIDTVFACNDVMALGAVEAIRAAGRTGAIRVVGFDAIDDARKAMADGSMAASVAQFPEEMGRIAVENAVHAVRGEAVPPEVKVRIELVTKDNLTAR